MLLTPRVTRSSQTNFVTSSFWLQDASYVRLKNLTLGYTLPQAWLTKAGIANAKVFLTGENLFLLQVWTVVSTRKKAMNEDGLTVR